MKYYGIDNPYAYHLAHFGVPGMKWGVRHDPEPSGRIRGSRPYSNRAEKIENVASTLRYRPHLKDPITSLGRKWSGSLNKSAYNLLSRKKSKTKLAQRVRNIARAHTYNRAQRMEFASKNIIDQVRTNKRQLHDKEKRVRWSDGELVSRKDLSPKEKKVRQAVAAAGYTAATAATIYAIYQKYKLLDGD